MPEGRVIVGFSNPYVAKYNNAGGNVTYTEGRRLARGVSVSLSVETADGNDFYADDVVAESENGQFAGGQVKLTVDGLHDEADRFISGLPEPVPMEYGEDKSVNIQKYTVGAQPPDVGIGFIIQYRSGGVTTFVPMILTKGKFQTHGTEATRREGTVSWQTQELTADLSRDDTPDQAWKWVAEAQTSGEAADAILQGLLGVGVNAGGDDAEV